MNLVASHVGKTWVLDDNTGGHVLGNDVALDDSGCVLLSQETAGIIIENLVILDKSFAVNQDDSIEVIIDGILFNEQLLFTLNNEDALTLRIFYHIEFDLRLAGVLTTECYVGLDIGVNLVGYDGGIATLDNQNALVVIVPDHIAVGETLQPEGTVDVILQVLHRHLVPEILVVEEW